MAGRFDVRRSLRAAALSVPLRAMVGAVGHKATCLRELPVTVDSRQTQVGGDRRGDLAALTQGEGVLEDHKTADSCGLAGLKLPRDLLGRAHLKGLELDLRNMRCGLELLVGEGRVGRTRIDECVAKLARNPRRDRGLIWIPDCASLLQRASKSQSLFALSARRVRASVRDRRMAVA
jgi:hypothetical protein